MKKNLDKYKNDIWAKEPKLRIIADKIISKHLNGLSYHEVTEILRFITDEATRFAIIDSSVVPR